jgi:hypothetical protein
MCKYIGFSMHLLVFYSSYENSWSKLQKQVMFINIAPFTNQNIISVQENFLCYNSKRFCIYLRFVIMLSKFILSFYVPTVIVKMNKIGQILLISLTRTA